MAMKKKIIEQVILVDESDNEIGIEEKIKAHQKGKLHRAFSVFVFNDEEQLLLQKRAKTKYHSGGLWTNTCCGHNRPSEELKQAAKRRLREEMGLECGLKKIFSFVYKTKFKNGLIEHEYLHVFEGTSNKIPDLNKEEAEDYQYVSLNMLEKDMLSNPKKYTAWFRLSLLRYSQYSVLFKVLRKPILIFFIKYFDK